ncbi:MAG: MFS transporter [Patescibacteria group bacterium]|jgi:MFS family permease
MHPAARALLIGSNTWYFGEGLFGPLFAVYAEKIGGDVLDITWAWAVYLIVTGGLMVVFGKMWDKQKNKAELMVAGYALNAICTFGYLFVSEPIHLLIVQVGLGIASAMATPTWDALYEKYGEKRKVGTLWGLAEGEAQVITGLGVLAGGFIVTFASFKTLFWSMGVVQVLATTYQAFSLRHLRSSRKK